jgi:hypothetical protein
MSRAGRIIYRLAGLRGWLLSHCATAYVSAATLMRGLARWRHAVLSTNSKALQTQEGHSTILTMARVVRSYEFETAEGVSDQAQTAAIIPVL